MIKSLKLNNVYAYLCLACRPKKLFSRAAILLAAFFFSLSIFSCDNSSSDNMALFAAPTPAQPAATVNENGKQMVSFSGCLGGAAGAFPARMSAQVSALLDGGQSDGLSMSAAPTLDTEAGGGYEMFATATAEGAPAVEGVFGTTAADKRFFSMSLEVGKTWSVVCGIRAAGGGSVMEDSFDFEAKITSPVLSHTFNLTPKKDGSGSVALSVTADSTVDKAVALCFDEAWKQAAPAGEEKALDLTSAAALSVGSLKSGSYEVSLNFFKDDGSGGRVFLYSVLQTINVFDNAATDMWISSAGEGKIQTAADGKTSLVVDGSEIMASARTIFYVSDAAGAAALRVSAPSDSNSGSAYEPLESLERAAQIISAAGNSANKKEYKIFINGNVPCNASLDSSLDAVASGITITGLGASGSSDALQGNGSNSVVTLATKAPVTIKNLSVTGGGGSSGAGVNITASGARLVLASGAKVIGNTAASSGGGVSVCAGAELDMLAGSEISANVCDGSGAGGVQNHGTFKMSGGTIENNKANDVGAVLVEEGSVFEISGSASIPYGALDSSGNLVTGEGKNDVFLSAITGGGGAVETITVAGNLYASGTVATIHAKDWPRGKQVLAAGAGVSALTDDILEKFDFTDTDFHVNRKKDDARQGLLAGDIYVAGSGYRHCLAAGIDADGVAGTKSAPFASISYAASKILDGGKNTILVDGSLGAQEVTSGLLAANCSELTIKGWSDATHPALGDDGLPVNKLAAGGSGSVFKTESAVPIVMENLMITGGSNISGDGKGGGIYVAGGANVTLKAGAVVAGNTAKKGGGVYVDGSFTLDGGVIGDASKTEHATRLEYSNNATSGYSFGGGIFFSNTGKVNIKSGVIAYNFAYRGGGISCENSAYSPDSQLTIEGGEIRHNCSASENGAFNNTSFGGGVFANGSKFSFTGGEIYENYGCDGAGGLFLQNASGAVMSGGSVYDNVYDANGSKYGSDLLLWDSATLSMSGGKIYSASQKERGVIIWNATDSLSMSGSAFISQNTPVLLGEPGGSVNTPITIAGALTPPDGDPTKKNAYIVPAEWKRGTVIAKGKDGDEIPSGSENRLALAAEAGDGWQLELSSDKKSATIDAPIYVAAGAAYDAATNPGGYRVCGSGGDNSKIGTKSSPYATVTKALGDLNNSGKHYTIYIDGTVSENLTINSRSGASPNVTGAKSITFKGAATTLATPISITEATADCLNGGGTGRVITMLGPVPVITNSLKISGGKFGDEGGGIFIAYDADLTLDDNTFVTGNSVYYDGGASLIGGGISVNGALNIKGTVKVHDNKKLDGSGVVIGDSNVYLPSGKVMKVSGALDGSEIHVTTGAKPSIDFATSPATVKTVTITNEYYVHNSTDPSEFFKSDDGYGMLFDSYYGEAVFGVHGGGISVEDIYKNVELSVNKTWVTKAKLADGSARFIVSGTIDGQAVNFITPTNDYYASISLKLLYHGEEIPQTSSYYSVTNCYLYLYSGLPAGDYVLAATCVYKEKTYSASFDIKVIGDSAPGGYVMTGGETVTGAVGTAAPSRVFITGRTVDIPVIIACDHEVTQKEYQTYCYYGTTNRPTDELGKGDNYPAYYVSWYDALVYCNLRSIAEGLTPVYSIGGKTDPKQWSGIKVGTGDDLGKYRGPEDDSDAWKAAAFDQNANGWRLPTEAEWEYLARAANTMDYYCSGTSGYTENDLRDYVWYANTATDNAAHEVNTKQANALGLHDMSGNVYEWCWDWSTNTVYPDTPATGPNSGANKKYRGGSYTSGATICFVNVRGVMATPKSSSRELGFRVVRNAR